MKKREHKELKDKTIEELKVLAQEKREEIAKLKGEMVIQKHKNLRIVKLARTSLARIQTVLRDKQLKSKIS